MKGINQHLRPRQHGLPLRGPLGSYRQILPGIEKILHGLAKTVVCHLVEKRFNLRKSGLLRLTLTIRAIALYQLELKKVVMASLDRGKLHAGAERKTICGSNRGRLKNRFLARIAGGVDVGDVLTCHLHGNPGHGNARSSDIEKIIDSHQISPLTSLLPATPVTTEPALL